MSTLSFLPLDAVELVRFSSVPALSLIWSWDGETFGIAADGVDGKDFVLLQGPGAGQFYQLGKSSDGGFRLTLPWSFEIDPTSLSKDQQQVLRVDRHGFHIRAVDFTRPPTTADFLLTDDREGEIGSVPSVYVDRWRIVTHVGDEKIVLHEHG